VDLIASILEIDPKTVVEARVELAENTLRRLRSILKRGDAVQGSEKLYKVVEECIKALAQYYNLEHQIAVKEGRWWIQLLGKTSRRLSKILKEPKIECVWAVAYDIHVWGFHEGKYSIEDIEEDVEHVKWLLNYMRQVITAKQH
jgi:hypothetical protein